MLHTVLYVITFFVALIASNVINKVFPKLPLPFIQVVFGMIMGWLGAAQYLRLNPEMFLTFVISPLLFREAEEADIKGIVKHGRTVLLLVFPVVFITALSLGYLSNLWYASIPLAACFAIGSSLGPTDAVAVGTLQERFDFPNRITSVLKGEGLFNDASGIIAFQLSILALTTGAFSIKQAGIELAISAVGGALLGLVIAGINRLLLSLMEAVAARDVTGYILLELVLPIVAYLVAEEVHVSGIIAVVVCGIMQANGLKKITLFDAQVESVAGTLWTTVTFVLNAIVFLSLGAELEQIATPIIQDSYYNNWRLIFAVLSLTIALFLTRFVILNVYYAFIAKKRKQRFLRYMNDILLLTFSGVKGTVSIATILLLPASVATQYPLMIFLSAMVTLVSFLTGIIVLPIIATPKKENKNNIAQIAMLTEVMAELTNEYKQSKNKIGYYATIDNYNERIQKLIIQQESGATNQELNDLRILMLRIESDGLENALRNGEISIKSYQIYQRYIKEIERSVVHRFVSSLQFAIAILIRAIRLMLAMILNINIELVNRRAKLDVDVKLEVKRLYFTNTSLVLEALENLEGIYNAQLIDFLQAERLRTAELVAGGGVLNRIITRANPNNLDEMMRGYYLERKLIFEYEMNGTISAREARRLRKNVNVLEDYSMDKHHGSLFYEFLDYKDNR